MTDMAPSSFFDPTNSPGTSPAATEAVAALETIADDERAVGMAAYMRDQFEFFGIAATPRKEAVKEIIAKRSLDWDFVFALWAHPKRECQYVAVDHLRRQKLTIADLGQLQELVETKSWWDTVDHLAKCAGTALVPGSRGRGKKPNPLNDASSARALMLEWAEAENMWTRRIAILCQLSFDEKTDTQLLREVIESNLGVECSVMTEEMKRRDKIRNLALRMIDPKQKFTTTHRRQLSEEIMGSNLAGRHLEKVAISEAVEELSADEDSGFDAEDFIPPKSVITEHSTPKEK